MFSAMLPLTLTGLTSAASLLWDGRANEYKDATFLNNWSLDNKVGPYQYYIHGSSKLEDYVILSSDFANLKDTGSDRGFQISIDDTSSWHAQNMMRTELIPQTDAAINQSKVYYHFSIQHTHIHPPSQTEEHQLCFFENHFTELKYGPIPNENIGTSNKLHWMADSKSQWSVILEAGVWHNVAYEIDFDLQTVAFHHSIGADALELAAGPFPATTFSDAADWHLGVLRLPPSSGSASKAREDWHFSGVYIENGTLTTSVSGSRAS